MADCDLCGVGRPTLCPLKVHVQRFYSAYPKGMWMNLCEECTEATHDSFQLNSEKSGNKCQLCGKKGEQLYAVEIRIPDFSEPYYKEDERALCADCLQAGEDAYNRRQKEKAEEHEH
ncbi:MAG: F(420)H(2) dehydrogenase subunit O [ANME-2 cluster archaeon HR1]|nr:MAG: F(420)H(2) dehydrogenase subunit O [ANME-2 cluster archaeon HR1]